MALKAEEVYAILKKQIQSGGATPEQIQAAVDAYLEENPVQPGATVEQATQIEKNKADISELSENLDDITQPYLDGNIFNGRLFGLNQYYDETGTLQTYAYYKYSNLFKCEGGVKYKFAMRCFINYFDDDKRFISGSQSRWEGHENTSPQNAKYMRVSIDTSTENMDNLMIVKNNLPSDFLPYRVIIKSEDLDYLFHISLIGKKIYCIGDSQTQGYEPNGTYIDKPYPFWLSEYSGANVTNRGINGFDSIHYWDVISQGKVVIPNDVDIFTIMLGTNGGLNDGLSTDVEPYDNYEDFANTETGCYCKIIEHILSKNIESQIFLVKPMYNYYDEDKYNDLLSAINEIPKIADRYKLPVINLFGESGISKFTLPHYSSDLLHFNDEKGHKIIANLIYRNIIAKCAF